MSNIQIPYHFQARDYQRPFLQKVEEAINGENDIHYFIQMWHRRSGKDKTGIADIAPRRLIKDPALVKYVYPTLVMGRDNLWDGIGSDGFKYLDHIPEEIRAGHPNQSRMTMPVKTMAAGHSLFQIAGSDNPDSLRGGNAKLYIFSEWSEQDPYALDVVDPIIKENGGIVVFNFTPKGENHAQGLVKYAEGRPDWHTSILTVEDTHIFTREQLDNIKIDLIARFLANGRSEEEAIAYYDQEYMCSFESSVVGAYYGTGMRRAEEEGRITNVPYERRLPVNTYWDLGMDDSMTIWFFQQVGQELRFIDYYENSGEGLGHYARVLNQKEYVYGRHTFPHDGVVRELGTGKSRQDVAMSLGIKPVDIAPRLGVDSGIDAVRAILNQCWFDKVKCKRGILALKNYQKDWDDKNKVFRTTPKHNWASHGADGFRTFGVSYRRPVRNNGNQPMGFGGVKPFIPGIG